MLPFALARYYYNEVTIITAIYNIKANKGSQTAGIDQLKMDKDSLAINEINKVPNLAWMCVNCHKYIHGMGILIKTTKEIKIKAKARKDYHSIWQKKEVIINEKGLYE